MIASATQPESVEHTLTLTARQTIADDVIDRPDVTELLYGGAKGGGKSVYSCIFMLRSALELIERFDLRPTRYPIPIGFMGRQRGSDFKRTTLETWKKMIPAALYELRTGDQEIVIGGAVKITYGGLDDRESINKFNSAEICRFALDQAEEMTRDDVSVLRGAQRQSISGVPIPPKGLFTANPAPGFLREEFILNPTPERRYVQALPGDNPYLPESYVQTLKDAFRHRPELLEAYLYGSWDSMEGPDQVIKDAWVSQALSRRLHVAHPRHFLVCDPARFGDDETVIYRMVETDIAQEMIYGQKDGMYTANVLHIMAVKEHHPHGKCSAIVIDTTGGLGGVVADRLREMADGAYQVFDVEAAGRPYQRDRYLNRRAEMWDTAARMFGDGDVELSHDEPTLRGQLSTPRYEYRNGKLLVEGKDKIKERLNRSPDRADAYVMGLANLDLIPATGRRTRYRPQSYGEVKRQRGAARPMSAMSA